MNFFKKYRTVRHNGTWICCPYFVPFLWCNTKDVCLRSIECIAHLSINAIVVSAMSAYTTTWPRTWVFNQVVYSCRLNAHATSLLGDVSRVTLLGLLLSVTTLMSSTKCRLIFLERSTPSCSRDCADFSSCSFWVYNI